MSETLHDAVAWMLNDAASRAPEMFSRELFEQYAARLRAAMAQTGAPHLVGRRALICAFAAPASGPGWANAPVQYIVQDGNQRLQKYWLQPDEQTPEVMSLYRVSAVVSEDMTRVVRQLLHERGLLK